MYNNLKKEFVKQMFVASLKLWLKNFKGPRHGLRLKFQFLFMKWITCSFWMIGKNINIKGQVTSEIPRQEFIVM